MQFAHFTFDTETDRLGEGPLSEVYRAMDTRLGRRVALKILRGNAEIDPAADTRFLREAQHTSQLVHPNIATVFEYGRHNGTSFIAMELLLGRTLDRILKERPLSFEEGARVALDVAKALSLVHSHGLIHRDLKPANIMMLEDGSVKLLDFGIARARDESTITQNGILVGTVLYMSPEQVRGEDLDTRSDVFAFGSVFYHALTGVLPFPGKSFPEVCMAILDCKPRHPAQVRPDFPPKLQEFLLRCLSKDSSQRYADSQEIQRVLQGIVDGSRSLDAVTNTIEGTLLIPPVTCVGTDLEACSLMSGSLRKDLIGELKRVRGIEIVKIEDQELPRNVSFDYVLRMDLETQGEKGRLQIGLERWTDRIGGRRAAKPIEVAQDSLEDSDKNDFALQDKLVRLAVRTLKKRLSELTIRPATTTTRDVEKSQMLTRHAHEVLHRGTTKHLLSSISSFRSAIDADPNSALPHAGMAEALVRKYLYFDGDMSYIEEARVEAAHALARDPNCAEAHTSLGFAFHLLGRTNDAQREYRMAIQLDHSEWLAHRLLGALYARAGNFKDASPLLRRAIALHPTQIASYDHLYGVLQRLDRYEESLQIADKGIGAAQDHLARFPDSQEARLHLGMLFARLGQADDAREQVKKAFELAPKDCYTAFHAAIVLAILLDIPEAMAALNQAAARGYNIQSEAPRNSDLDPLRGLPEFQALVS